MTIKFKTSKNISTFVFAFSLLAPVVLSSVLSSVLTLNAAAASVAGQRNLSTGDGKVEFLAIGRPGFLKVKGEGAKPKGTVKLVDGKASGEFTVELSQFKTWIELRDEHMKDKYLEVGAHPKAIIRFSGIEVKSGAGKTVVPAELELHGQKKRQKRNVEVSGTFASSSKPHAQKIEAGTQPRVSFLK